VLRKRLNFNQKEESSSWQHFWFTLRGHRLSFFLNRLKRHYTHCISLVEMLSIDDTSEAEMNFFNEFNVSCDGKLHYQFTRLLTIQQVADFKSNFKIQRNCT
jgi:hypothetical protein